MFGLINRRRHGARTARVELTLLMLGAVSATCLASGCSVREPSGGTKTTTDIEQVHDIGTVLVPSEPGAVNEISHTFEIVNPSDSVQMPIEIMGSSCSCVIAAVSRQPVRPGQVGKVVLSTRSGRVVREIREHATVRIGASQVRLVIRAKVVPRLMLELNPAEPPRIIGSGTRCVTATVISNAISGELDCPIALAASGAGLSIGPGSTAPSVRSADGLLTKSQSFIVTLNTASTVGVVDQMVEARLVARCGQQSCTSDIRWLRLCPIQCIPSHVFLDVRSSTHNRRSIKLISGEPFRVLSVDAPIGVAISVAKSELRKTHDMTVSVNMPASGLRFKRLRVVVQTDHPQQEFLAVVLHCSNISYFVRLGRRLENAWGKCYKGAVTRREIEMRRFGRD